jgi:aminoglycoside phosphotransferase (APT) family kinase protein
VGMTLARVHGLHAEPRRPDLYAGRAGQSAAELWPDLVGRARSAGAPWADLLDAAEPWARRASALLVDDGTTTVLSHGDVDQRNLLLAADGLHLIDWDVVLPVVASHDLAHAAVTMATWRDPAVARAVIDGYAAVSGAWVQPQPDDLGPALAARLGWICFTVDRYVEARARGASWADEPDVPTLLADLEHRVATAERLDDWLEARSTHGRHSTQ